MNISLMAEISFTPTDKTPIVTAAPKMLRFTEAPVHRFHSLATRSHSESRAAWVLGSVIGAFRAGALPGENRSRAGLAHDLRHSASRADACPINTSPAPRIPARA